MRTARGTGISSCVIQIDDAGVARIVGVQREPDPADEPLIRPCRSERLPSRHDALRRDGHGRHFG
ncbi:MAG TPA: hypothetical protein VH701_11120 [Vicinamibacterales bacterium]